MNRQPLNLNESVTNVVKLVKRTIPESISVDVHLSPSPIAVEADAIMMDQVLINLAINARDAMPRGGHLTFEVTEKWVDTEQALLDVNAVVGRHAVLRVSDTGCGIPPAVLPHIFEPFFTTKEFGKGTGLGLATVHGIVKQHGGWITVHTEVGHGTSFEVHLPAIEAPAAKPATFHSNESRRLGDTTVLLVEDDSTLRMSTRRALEQSGYRVLEAADSQAALEVWAQHRDRIALLLTDMVMPGGISGRELATQLGLSKPSLKIVIMSGYRSGMAGCAVASGSGEHFLQKPFAIKTLLHALQDSLESPAIPGR